MLHPDRGSTYSRRDLGNASELVQFTTLCMRSPYGGQAVYSVNEVIALEGAGRAYSKCQFDCEPHESPSRTVDMGEKHEMAHQYLFTCDEQASVDIGAGTDQRLHGLYRLMLQNRV